MIVGGIQIRDCEDIICVRMNWMIQIEVSSNLPVSPPNRSVASSGSGKLKASGRYWSADIVDWLKQRAAPFWNTISAGGTYAEAAVAYMGARLWNATGGRVVKFVAKQTLRQMVLRPAMGIGGGLAVYFAAVTVVAHDIYVALDENVETQKFLGEGVKIGGGGFGV